MLPVFAPLAALWRVVIDTVLPPRCIGTGDIVDTAGMISPAFWPQIHFIDAPFCAACGLPFGFDLPAGALCGGCMEQPPVFDHARAATVYNDASRQLVLGFKYGDKLHSIHTFAPWMIRAGHDLLPQADIIAPIPLSARRLRERRFNQSALLAQEIARRTRHTYLADALLRTRHTPPQKGLSRKDRLLNVNGAFAVNPRRAERLKGKCVLLIDDVYTTGATLNECARTLKAAGVTGVDVLTIARVTKEEL